jgi:hypothetical protein
MGRKADYIGGPTTRKSLRESAGRVRPFAACNLPDWSVYAD